MFADVHGWDRLIDQVPTLFNILVTGFVAIGLAVVKKRLDENTASTKRTEALTSSVIPTALDQIDSKTREIEQARKTCVKGAASITEHVGSIRDDLQTVKHELNGGFAEKVQKAMADHVIETKKRFDRIEERANDVQNDIREIKELLKTKTTIQERP